MFREIKKKKLIIENRKPYNSDINNYITELNLIDMVYSTMKLDGSLLTRDHVSRIINGEFIINATLMDHAKVERYKAILNEMYSMNEMGYELNLQVLQKLYFLLTDNTKLEYRRTNPVLSQWSYNPPNCRDADELDKWRNRK